MEPSMQGEIGSLVTKHGAVPPPWVIFDENPYSICWRMGYGESYQPLWWEWWRRQRLTEDQRITYFRRWPPPHCWLVFLIAAVWDVHIESWDIYACGEEAKVTPYFERTATLGFGNQEDYERDLRDPKWLER